MTLLCRPPATFEDMDDIVRAINKVLGNKEDLLKQSKWK
jgi:hypothetical protein